MFERSIITCLVNHKSNPKIRFVVYDYNRDTSYYYCRHVSSFIDNNQPVIEGKFLWDELEIIESNHYFRNWLEFQPVSPRTNPSLTFITLHDLPERGKTNCRWVSTDESGRINIHEFIFMDFELIKIPANA